MKKTVAMAAILAAGLTSNTASAAGSLQCEPGETYVMNVMVLGHPYWVPVYQGFKQAAEAFGCETVFSGTPEYDITKQIASFEQDMIKQPAGILLHPMQADPFIEMFRMILFKNSTKGDIAWIEHARFSHGPKNDIANARAFNSNW